MLNNLFKKIALFYGHSASNIGDLAINSGQIELLHSAFPFAEVNVIFLNGNLSPFLDFSKNSFQNKGAIKFLNLEARIDKALMYLNQPSALLTDLNIDDVDLILVSSGEHLFQSEAQSNRESFFWRSMPIYVAKACGLACGVLPSTFGPYESECSKNLISKLIDISDYVGVRDVHSFQLIKTQLQRENISLTLDPAFYLDATSLRESEKKYNKVGLIVRAENWGIRLSSEKRRVLTNRFREESYTNSIAFKFFFALISNLISETDKSCVIFVQTDADQEVSDCIINSFSGKYRERINIYRPSSVEDYLDALSHTDCIITSRFHAAILGFNLGKNVFGVYLDVHGHKMPGLFEFLGVPEKCINLTSDLSDNVAKSIVTRICQGHSSEKLDEKLQELKHFGIVQIKKIENSLASKHDLEEIYKELVGQLFKLCEIKTSTELNRELKKYKNKLKKLELQYEELDKHLNIQLKEKLSLLRQAERDVNSLKNKVSNLKQQKQALESINKVTLKQLNKIIFSTSYKLGEQIKKDIKRPLHWPLLPIKLARLYFRYKRRKNRGNVQYLTTKNTSTKGKICNGSSSEADILSLLPRKVSVDLKREKIKRICYVLHNSLPYASGGYATRAHGVAKGLVENGYEVVCLTRPGFPLDVNKELTVEKVLEQNIDGVIYKRILTPLRKGIPSYKYMESIIAPLQAKISEIKPDLVIAASFYLTALPAMIVSRRLEIPFVYEVRGLAEITRISRDKSYLGTAKYNNEVFMETETANNSDFVFTLTQPMKDEMIKRGVNANKIFILPNCCNINKFQPRCRSLELAKELSIPKNVPVIGYIGTFVDYEGLEDLVAACVILKRRGAQFRLLIVGSENVSISEKGAITKTILELSKKENLKDWLILPGRVPHSEVERYYSLIDIAPFPRKPWPVCEMVSPMKPLEALAMEKAVVVSSVTALAQMIRNGETGLVYEKGDINSLSEVLYRLVNDLKLRKELGKNAREWVRRERSWVRTTSKAINFISS